MAATPKVLDFAPPKKALVRFPTEAEQAKGLTEAPRWKRILEKEKELSDNKS